MSSGSFKRKVKVSDSSSNSNAQPVFEEAKIASGWKPWIHTGLGMVSCGHRQLDDLLFGGVPLGSVMLYELESFSNYGNQLYSYGVAEGISHKQPALIIVANGHAADELIESLPYNQNIGHSNQPSSNGASSSESNPDTAPKKDWGLKIAWQYEKYLASNQGGSKSAVQNGSSRSNQLSYCCSYDLSRHLQPELIEGNIRVECVSADSLSSKCANILHAIRSFLSSNPPDAASRIYIPHFHELLVGLENDCNLLMILGKFILNMKMLVKESKTAIFLSIKVDAISKMLLSRIEQLVDITVTVESFSGRMHAVPYEFRDYLAFFIIKKIAYAGMMASPQPKASKFGIKRDRRKLHIEPLHLPPEESRAFGSSGCSDAKATNATEKPVVGAEKTTIQHSDKASNNDTAKNIAIAKSGNEPVKEEKPKSSLANALAAAKAQRAAAAQSKGASAYMPVPISISKKSVSSSDVSKLDF